MSNLTVGLLIALAAILVMVVIGWRRVPPDQTYTINRFGRFHRTLAPGMHFLVPLIDRISHRVSMAGRAVEVSCTQLHTNDQHAIVASGMIYFQVLDPRKAASHVRTLDQAARNLTEKTAIGMVEQMSYHSLSHHSSGDLNAWLLGLLNQSASEWGVRITRINLKFGGEQPPQDSSS